MKRTLTLYQLQQLETDLEKTAQRKKEIHAAIGESTELKRARKAAAETETAVASRRVVSRDIDLEVRGVIQRIQANEQRLYSGSVTNPKELANLQDDTLALKRYQEKKEQELLEAMVAEEEAEAAADQAKKRLTAVETKWAKKQAALSAELEEVEARLVELNEGREELTARVEDEDLQTYQNLRRKKGGLAVALVENGICQGCRMPPPTSQLQQATTGTSLVFCSNCGRILHVP
jgi:uncharacterized protein